LDTPRELIDCLRVEGQTVCSGLIDHPQQRKFGQLALPLRVAAADVGMHAREPDLLAVLRIAIVGFAEAVSQRLWTRLATCCCGAALTRCSA